MYLLLAFGYWQIEWDIVLLLPFATINNISISVKYYNFDLFFLKTACYANQGAGKYFAGSSPHILKHIFLKFQTTSANNNVSLWTCKSRYSPKFFISKSLQTLFACA